MKRLRAGSPIECDTLRLIPVESTEVHVGHTFGRLTAVASKRPVAIVACLAGRVWALDLDGRETSLSTLLSDVDGLPDVMP